MLLCLDLLRFTCITWVNKKYNEKGDKKKDAKYKERKKNTNTMTQRIQKQRHRETPCGAVSERQKNHKY